jgi:hypothetical protein
VLFPFHEPALALLAAYPAFVHLYSIHSVALSLFIWNYLADHFHDFLILHLANLKL